MGLIADLVRGNTQRSANKEILPVTIIITIWQRKYLKEQLEALCNQTFLPEHVWILQNESHIDVTSLVKRYSSRFPNLFHIKSDVNFKYFGRFSFAMHVKTEFVWLLDDDVIPGRKWLQICYEKCSAMNAVIGSAGRILQEGNFLPEKYTGKDAARYFIGDNNEAIETNYCEKDTVVDYACNSYFLKSQWLSEFWAVWPSTFMSGEDIHLSASLKIRKNIPTIVPEQLNEDALGNLKKSYSCDKHSSWRKPAFYEIREGVFRHFIQNLGWKPVLWQ